MVKKLYKISLLTVALLGLSGCNGGGGGPSVPVKSNTSLQAHLESIAKDIDQFSVEHSCPSTSKEISSNKFVFAMSCKPASSTEDYKRRIAMVDSLLIRINLYSKSPGLSENQTVVAATFKTVLTQISTSQKSELDEILNSSNHPDYLLAKNALEASTCTIDEVSGTASCSATNDYFELEKREKVLKL
jgi:hypothetical protein